MIADKWAELRRLCGPPESRDDLAWGHGLKRAGLPDLLAERDALLEALKRIAAAWDRTVFADDFGDNLGGDNFRERVGVLIAEAEGGR